MYNNKLLYDFFIFILRLEVNELSNKFYTCPTLSGLENNSIGYRVVRILLFYE